MTISSDESAVLQESLQALLDLQDEDLRADQLRHRRAHLPERSERNEIEAELAKMSAQSAAASKERADLNAKLSAEEAESAEFAARIKAIEAQLSGGGAASFRDQEAMALEIESLARRRRMIEDEQLEAMESLEPLDAYFAEQDVRAAQLAARRAELDGAIAQAEIELDRQISELEATRQVLLARVPKELASEYEKLRQHLGGIGAARLVHNTCSGCNLSLSASEIDRIRRGPLVLLHCEQCGRILVP